MDLPFPELESKLMEVYGHSTFREGQRRVIEALMQERSSLAVFPTGGGKSICYQLPAVLLEGLTLVISPLIALMKDQVDALRARGVAAARLDSTLTAAETMEIFQHLEDGKLKLLYVAPERLVSEAFVRRIRKTRVALMAIDESHCISEWGHNFRPEYLRLAKVAKQLRVGRVLALTATATPEVVKSISTEFRILKKDVVQTSFHRPNLSLHITPVAESGRLDLLGQKLNTERRFPSIVYVTLQQTAETVAAYLKKSGILARAYHAGLPDDVRSSTQDDFMQGRCEVIVATIAFGMGIDKADIRAVYHYNLPKTLENYQQEIGRAGRDGAPSHCEMLACADDLTVLENFVLGDTPEEAALRLLVDHLLRQGEEFAISKYEISRTTDIRPLVVETVLTYLEKEGILEPSGLFYTTFQVGFLHPEASVVAGHTTERQRFLKKLFASGKRGSRWLTINVEEAVLATGATRERVLKALGFLEEAHDITMKPSGLRHQFRLLPGATGRKPHEVAGWLYELFIAREKRDLERLKTVTELATDPGCTTKHLLAYFGEIVTGNCGHCDHCQRRGDGKALPRSTERTISADAWIRVMQLRREGTPALRSARTMTRFLCGLSSPAITRDRLSRHDAFGLLEGVPFATVLERVESGR